MSKKVIILLGPPGCGKGTQALVLKEKLSIPHISTGDLFREEIKKLSPIGLKAKQFIDAGHLVPEDIVIEMLKGRIHQQDCKQGFILDGFPRTLHQANVLATVLDTSPSVIYFNLSDDVIIERITGRLTCPSCGSIFHIKFSPPKKPMICDKCSSTLIQRPDDKEEVVRQRLKTYHEQTSPLIRHYQDKHLLQTVDCHYAKEKVTDIILQLLKIT
ncbi:MAG: adenylate kinase [Chlamydiales bacterium]|nr:adenylate kinase [Chlamydiales bacterium]